MKYKKPLLGLIFSLLFAILPIAISIGAGTFAEANGCVLNEGGATQCVLLGIDWGGTLYTLGVLGWFFIVSMPIGAFGAIVCVGWLLAVLLKSKQ